MAHRDSQLKLSILYYVCIYYPSVASCVDLSTRGLHGTNTTFDIRVVAVSVVSDSLNEKYPSIPTIPQQSKENDLEL